MISFLQTQTTTQQQDVNTLLLMILTIIMIGRAIDRFLDNKNNNGKQT